MPFTKEQLLERRKYVGASEVPAILGMSPYRNQNELTIWAEKVSKDEPMPSQDTDNMEWGREVEPAILRVVSRVSGLKLRATVDSPEGQASFVDPVGGLIKALPDGIGMMYSPADPHQELKDKAVMEAKSVGPSMRGRWGDPIDGSASEEIVPDYVQAQVQAQMLCSGLDEAYIGASLGGPPWVYSLKANKKVHEMMRAIISEWWEKYVVKEVPPAVKDGGEATQAFLARIFPGKTGEKLYRAARAEENMLIEAWLQARRESKIVEDNAKYLEAKVKETIGNDYGLETKFGKMAWTTVEEKVGPDTKKVMEWVKENHPEVLEACKGVVKKGYRRLETKGLKLDTEGAK